MSPDCFSALVSFDLFLPAHCHCPPSAGNLLLGHHSYSPIMGLASDHWITALLKGISVSDEVTLVGHCPRKLMLNYLLSPPSFFASSTLATTFLLNLYF